jgi:hypothetical protein
MADQSTDRQRYVVLALESIYEALEFYGACRDGLIFHPARDAEAVRVLGR